MVLFGGLKMSKYKVCNIVLCKNEEDVIPFCIDYWKRIANKVVVYDNGSTDSSIELLSQYDWIDVRHFDSEGHNDVIQKSIKEHAYLEFKDSYDIIIISDMDELFYFQDFEKEIDKMIQGNYNCMLLPLYSLCEDGKPQYKEDKLLHQLCHKYYKQRMNHTRGLEAYTKFSIFNTKITDVVAMSVGQHYVQTAPTMNVMVADNAFGIHIDKGFGEDYYVAKRRKMGENLSETNKRGRMGIEYLKSEEDSRKEYRDNQAKSFDINL